MVKLKGQTRASQLFKNCCLVWCYIYCAGIKYDIYKYCELALKLQDKGLVDENGNVLDGAKVMNYLTGSSNYKVIKRPISRYVELKDVENEPTPVLFNNCGYEHWVVVQNGKIVFNEWENSIAITGRLVTARIIKK